MDSTNRASFLNTSASPPVWTIERIRALGAVTDVATAGQIFGLSRSSAYELARGDRLPVPVLRVGSRYRVSVATILAALGVPSEPPTPPAT
ncbi:DNA-binding protein [Verrucosispora sp. WMMA2044]|uniref:DNA-binding protein n=1 Tax=Verrucosispora sp. WMMA2044 TaxID=3016419 RepID=UPI00248C29B5|nr:DNA-binding protein [Verrucosispora sp. WMMA2044]WBB48485.1 DNA-binding protein [Verrucosispora sp. WMMA2044]